MMFLFTAILILSLVATTEALTTLAGGWAMGIGGLSPDHSEMVSRGSTRFI